MPSRPSCIRPLHQLTDHYSNAVLAVGLCVCVSVTSRYCIISQWQHGLSCFYQYQLPSTYPTLYFIYGYGIAKNTGTFLWKLCPQLRTEKNFATARPPSPSVVNSRPTTVACLPLHSASIPCDRRRDAARRAVRLRRLRPVMFNCCGIRVDSWLVEEPSVKDGGGGARQRVCALSAYDYAEYESTSQGSCVLPRPARPQWLRRAQRSARVTGQGLVCHQGERRTKLHGAARRSSAWPIWPTTRPGTCHLLPTRAVTTCSIVWKVSLTC